MAFGSLNPSFPPMGAPSALNAMGGPLAGNNMALLQMLMARRQNPMARMAGAVTPPAAPSPNGQLAPDGGAGQSADFSASPGLINRALGMGPGMGMLNKLFSGDQGGNAQPGAAVPAIPRFNADAPGPNALTGMW